MKNYINCFQPGGWFENYLKDKEQSVSENRKQSQQESQMYYENDVTPRARRERSLKSKLLYNTPTFDLSIPIKIVDIIYNNDGTPITGASGAYDPKNNIFEFLRYTNTSPETYSHEMAHANFWKDFHNSKTPLKHPISWLRTQLIDKSGTPLQGIPVEEAYLLFDAYKTKSPATQDSEDLTEKHATNRELRQHILKLEFGDYPTDLKTSDDIINNLSDDKLLQYLQNQNDYGKDYYNYIKDLPEDQKVKAVKNIKRALIHVAQNNSGFQKSDNTYFARSGGKLNYLKFFKK